MKKRITLHTFTTNEQAPMLGGGTRYTIRFVWGLRIHSESYRIYYSSFEFQLLMQPCIARY